MSLALQIAIEKDEATPLVNRLQSQVSAHRMAAEIGPRGTRLVQRNFRKQAGNAKGWPSTHFWGRAAEATNWQESFGFVMISVNQIGIRQRLLGGDIRPVNAKALTLPAQPEAYGKRATEFPNLEFKIVLDPESGHMRAALVEKQGSVTATRSTRQKDGSTKVTALSQSTGLVALYWLAKSVHQDPNPEVMPSDQDWNKAFDDSVNALLPNAE